MAAALTKAIRTSGTISNLSKLFTNLSVSTSPVINVPSSNVVSRVFVNQISSIHTTAKNNGLMEFFDTEKNWGQKTVKVGRSWKLDELRIKSNEDLHKLWYVLLKEKNMLLTMEHACKEAFEFFPNPERIDKIEESMENLEAVVRERNTAYHLLETGETGERPAKIAYNQLGLRMAYRSSQHIVPRWMNKKWQQRVVLHYKGAAVHSFLRKYREKLFLEKRREKGRQKNKVQKLMRRYPDLDLESIKAHYPDVDVDKLKNSNYIRGHYLPR